MVRLSGILFALISASRALQGGHQEARKNKTTLSAFFCIATFSALYATQESDAVIVSTSFFIELFSFSVTMFVFTVSSSFELPEKRTLPPMSAKTTKMQIIIF